MGNSTLNRMTRGAFLIALLTLIAGCTASPPASTPSAPPELGSTELGAFPLNVIATQGKYEFSITSVRVEATDAVAGLDMGNGPRTDPIRARPGYRFVEVTLREHDTSLDPRPPLPFSSRSALATFTVTADGATAPEARRGGTYRSGGSDLSVGDHVMLFEVPDGTRELLLHMAVSGDSSQTLVFRLW